MNGYPSFYPSLALVAPSPDTENPGHLAKCTSYCVVSMITAYALDTYIARMANDTDIMLDFDLRNDLKSYTCLEATECLLWMVWIQLATRKGQDYICRAW